MKSLSLLVLLCLLFASTALSQNNSRVPETMGNPSSARTETEQVNVVDNSPIIAIVTENSDQSNLIYSFVSNKMIVEEQIDRLESRFKTMYPSIIEIEMSSSDQIITLTLPNTHTPEELLAIIKRFNFTDYQIVD